MNLRRFQVQKPAVVNGIFLGLCFVVINCILIFGNVSPEIYTAISYITVPCIIYFASLSGFQRMYRTNHIGYALQSSCLTVGLGLLIGFGSLFILTNTFIDIVKHSPMTIHSFRESGQTNIDIFIRNSLIHSATASVPVSTIIGILSGVLGAYMSIQVKRKGQK